MLLRQRVGGGAEGVNLLTRWKRPRWVDNLGSLSLHFYNLLFSFGIL